jgi:hypothetical protein
VSDRSLQEELLSYVAYDRRVRMAGKSRLRVTTTGVVPIRMLTEAADRIDTLEARLDGMLATVATWERACASYTEVLATQDAEIKALRAAVSGDEADACRKLVAAEAEIKRLRAELRPVTITLPLTKPST